METVCFSAAFLRFRWLFSFRRVWFTPSTAARRSSRLDSFLRMLCSFGLSFSEASKGFISRGGDVGEVGDVGVGIAAGGGDTMLIGSEGDAPLTGAVGDVVDVGGDGGSAKRTLLLGDSARGGDRSGVVGRSGRSPLTS